MMPVTVYILGVVCVIGSTVTSRNKEKACLKRTKPHHIVRTPNTCSRLAGLYPVVSEWNGSSANATAKTNQLSTSSTINKQMPT